MDEIFGDMFATEDDLLAGSSTGGQQGQTATYNQGQSKWKGKSCAALMPLPSLPREKYSFVGLKNQGATCYLNSLVQSLFMSPEFRSAVFKIPLCVGDDLEQKSDFVDSSNKQRLLMGFQKMFAQLQGSDIKSTSTTELTAAFGWEEKEAYVQQDIQEANRVIFDVVERALFGAPLEVDPSHYYRGTIINHITCTECQVPREREENFFDLMLQVDGYGSVEESLMAFITPELLNEDNQLFCEICCKKCDTLKGQKIQRFPDILTVSLNRFKFDMEKFDRVKVNSRFEFGLELNIAPFVEDSNIDDQSDDCNYELFTVLIHRGSAHGGHYYTYIRDQLGEGNWAEKMKSYETERIKREAERQEEAAKTKLREEEKAAKELEAKLKKQQETAAKKAAEGVAVDSAATDAEVPPPAPVADKEVEIDADVDNGKQTGKRNKKDKQQQQQSKKRDRQQKEEHKNVQEPKETDTNQKKNKKEEDKGPSDYQIDDTDFPRSFSNPKLGQGWYEFNDHSVTSIRVNRLQKQFGGSGSESAYILVYRKRSLAAKLETPQIPAYLQPLINKENENYKLERDFYEDALQHVEVTVHNGIESILDASMQAKKEYIFDKDGQTLRVHRDTSYYNFMETVARSLGNHHKIAVEDLALVEVFEHQNLYLQIVQVLQISGDKNEWLETTTIRSADVSNNSSWVVYDNKKHPEIVKRLEELQGVNNLPVKLNVIQAGSTLEVLAYSQWKLDQLKEKIAQVTGIPVEEQYITTEDLLHINSTKEKETLTLQALRILNDADLIVKRIDQETAKELEELHNQVDGKDGKKKLTEYQQAQLDGLVSILVENSDEQGVRRFFIDYRSMTLKGLLDYVKEKFGVEATSARRLRNLENNVLYFEDEYGRDLSVLSGFEEGGTRIRLERGDIPVSGNIPIKFKNQSNLVVAATSKVSGDETTAAVEEKVEPILKEVEILISSDRTFTELKEQACAAFKLNPADHKVYKCDWMEDPVQLIQNETLLIRNMQFKSMEVLVIRDTSNPISKEFERFTVYWSKRGTSDEILSIGDLSIRKDETLLDLKRLILATPVFVELNHENKITPAHLRIRDMRKDGLLGQIYRHNEKKISSNVYSTNNIAIQVMDEPDTLEEDDIVMILRKRDCEKRTYGGDIELVFHAGKKPSVSDLKQSVAELLKVEDVNSFHLVKYFPYEFAWSLISDEEYERLKDKKKAADGSIKPKKGTQPPSKKQAKVVADDKGTTPAATKADKAPTTTEQNVKKPPYLIKDGDILGYILKSEQKAGEESDYQTENDTKMKMWFEEEKKLKKANASSGKGRNAEGGGFKMNLDF